MSMFKRLIAATAMLGIMIVAALPAMADRHDRDRDRDYSRYDNHQAYWERRDREVEQETYRRFLERQRYWNARDSHNNRDSRFHRSGHDDDDRD